MKTLPSLFCLLGLIFTVGQASATEITVGEAFPPLNIESRGELVIKGEEVEFTPWSSASMAGNVVYFQYMAGRPSADKMNRHVNNALEESGIEDDNFISTVIVNLDDVTFGASGFAVKEMKKNKKKYPHTHLIADENGAGRISMGLQEESSAIGVIDKQGKVLFFKDGKLTESETAQVIELIRTSLQ